MSAADFGYPKPNDAFSSESRDPNNKFSSSGLGGRNSFDNQPVSAPSNMSSSKFNLSNII